MGTDGGASGDAMLTFANPTTMRVEVEVTPGSPDSRWSMRPDHLHTTLEPDERLTIPIRLARAPGAMEASR